MIFSVQSLNDNLPDELLSETLGAGVSSSSSGMVGLCNSTPIESSSNLTSVSNHIINSGGNMVNGMISGGGDTHSVMTTQQPMMAAGVQQGLRQQMPGNNANINLVTALTGPPGAKMMATAHNGPLISLGGGGVEMNSGMNNGMMIQGNKPPNMNMMGMMQTGGQQQPQNMRPNMMVRQQMPIQFQRGTGGMIQGQQGSRMNVRLANTAVGNVTGNVTMVSGGQVRFTLDLFVTEL